MGTRPTRLNGRSTSGTIGVCSAFAAVMRQTPTEQTFFAGLIGMDAFGMFFSALFLITAALAVTASIRFLDDAEAHYPEYYFFLLTALLGMMFMARAVDFVSLFVGLELQSLSVYVLAGRFALVNER